MTITNAQQEKFRRDLERARRKRRAEVEYWHTHPYPRDVGEQKAGEFMSSLAAQVEIWALLYVDGRPVEMEASRRSALRERMSELGRNMPPAWTVHAHFTAEQRAEIERLHARHTLICGYDLGNNDDEDES